jgi:homoserine O-acetyltransferase
VVETLVLPEGLTLESGAHLAPLEIAYARYGDPERPGWWDNLIGPGKPLDTDSLFVISANLLGGCRGTTGPMSIDPATGSPYGLRFPLFTVSDLVRVHRALVRHLGIGRLLGAIGGSLGGMQVLQWALDHPDDLHAGVVVCASARLSAQNIAFSAVARTAITRDEHFAGGDYYETGRRPDVGLAVARMMAHITYLSEQAMREKFGRRLQHGETPNFGFDIDFQVESYLDYQGKSFLERFDANSYLYLTRVMDYFDPFSDLPAAIAKLKATRTKFLVVSFDTDWRFDTKHSLDLVRVLQGAQVPVTFREIASPHGHDSFLLEVPEYHRTVAAFLDRVAAEVGAAN